MSPYRYRRQIAETPPPTRFWRKVKAWSRGFYTRLEIRQARRRLIEDCRAEYQLEAQWADAQKEATQWVRNGSHWLDFIFYMMDLSNKTRQDMIAGNGPSSTQQQDATGRDRWKWL